MKRPERSEQEGRDDGTALTCVKDGASKRANSRNHVGLLRRRSRHNGCYTAGTDDVGSTRGPNGGEKASHGPTRGR